MDWPRAEATDTSHSDSAYYACREKGRPVFAPDTATEIVCRSSYIRNAEIKDALIELAGFSIAFYVLAYIIIALDRRVRLWNITFNLSQIDDGRVTRAIASLFELAVIGFALLIGSAQVTAFGPWGALPAAGFLLYVYLGREAMQVAAVAYLRQNVFRDGSQKAKVEPDPEPDQKAKREREEPRASPKEPPHDWSRAHAEADYPNALQEAQQWANQATTKATTDRMIGMFQKKSIAPGIHPKDRLRYEMAIMLLREKLKSFPHGEAQS